MINHEPNIVKNGETYYLYRSKDVPISLRAPNLYIPIRLVVGDDLVYHVWNH